MLILRFCQGTLCWDIWANGALVRLLGYVVWPIHLLASQDKGPSFGGGPRNFELHAPGNNSHFILQPLLIQCPLG